MHGKEMLEKSKEIQDKLILLVQDIVLIKKTTAITMY